MINRNSIEAEIIKYLNSNYPVTIDSLRKNLRLTETTLFIHIKKLQDIGILKLEPAGDETYVTLLKHDIEFVELKRQHPTIKTKKPKKKSKPLNKKMYG